ncbi:MAG: RNA-binding S4 domain-containing protein [Oscillospiraceae bacterium]|nr:RNA-binding S4 domain-containing protein [Oscillospiraceae bacterium]
MRLDKYLKVSRIIKRRTVANEACDSARVTANGRPVKASYQVKVGDVLEITFGTSLLKLEVLALNEQAKKENASENYRILSRTGRDID